MRLPVKPAMTMKSIFQLAIEKSGLFFILAI